MSATGLERRLFKLPTCPFKKSKSYLTEHRRETDLIILAIILNFSKLIRAPQKVGFASEIRRTIRQDLRLLYHERRWDPSGEWDRWVLPADLKRRHLNADDIWTCFLTDPWIVGDHWASWDIFWNEDCLTNKMQSAYPGILSHVWVSRLTDGFSSPLTMANIELKLRRSRQCRAIFINFLMILTRLATDLSRHISVTTHLDRS